MTDVITEFNTAGAAKYLGYTVGTLAVSRSSGELAGVKPPAHFKRGHIFYRKSELDKWLASF